MFPLRNKAFRRSILCLLVAFIPGSSWGQSIDFQRDVRRILSRHCYQCHGPDQAARKAELRLDRPEEVIVELGGKAVSRKDVESSLLLERIHSNDPDSRMPPPEAPRQLSESDRQRLTRWIREGAQWEEHWAYQDPVRPRVPESQFASSAVGAIDQFIHHELAENKLSPSDLADSKQLVRRLHFDLIGLPPSPEIVKEYAMTPSPLAYDRLVESLLASPHFGERIAMYWFDLVRFANTTGVHADNVWHVTPYRNWVIDALNQNMPFDQFTREQLAGDLLPEATNENRIAATYNRLNLSTREGGSQAKEFLAKYMADRVRNAGSVWLASTIGCAECHDHKFDPISTKEFYQFGAFFADIEQVGVYGSDFPPYLKLPQKEQTETLQRLRGRVDAVEKTIQGETDELTQARHEWERITSERLDQLPKWSGWESLGPFSAASFDEAHDTKYSPEDDLSADDVEGDEALSWRDVTDFEDGKVWSFSSETGATYFRRFVETDHERSLTLWFGNTDSLRVWFNGKQVKKRSGEREVEKDQEKVDLKLKSGRNTLVLKVSVTGPKAGVYFRSRSELVPNPIRKALLVAAGERGDEETRRLHEFFREKTPLLEEERRERDSLRKEIEEVERAVERTLATVSVEPAVTRVLPRGNWMDESGEVVEPGYPMAYGGIEGNATERRTRLDLAEWLVDDSNPLTSRVFVNRLWMLFFGAGLTQSVDDFGYQGEAPNHPALLDWLAVEFRESGWDIKHMVRLIVSSYTYRQSADLRHEVDSRDPGNRYFSRQNRYRLPAEMIRDMYLRSSGLMVNRIGGYDVSRPYQPSGYYRHLNFPKRTYQATEDENQFRRGVYMHWQRQFLHPALKAFDAPTREECVAQRPQSNTPLAALVMMNDPSMIEASRTLAEATMMQAESELSSRIEWCFRQVLSRLPSNRELNVLEELWTQEHERFAGDLSAVEAFLDVGMSLPPEKVNTVELAAWTVVCRTILNMHEAILRP